MQINTSYADADVNETCEHIVDVTAENGALNSLLVPLKWIFNIIILWPVDDVINIDRERKPGTSVKSICAF